MSSPIKDLKRTVPSSGRLRVLIAGAGVAGLETMLALRHLAAEYVEIEVLSPWAELRYWPLLVTEPFGAGKADRIPLDPLFAGHGVRLHRGFLSSVDADARRVRSGDGEELGYDVLVVAVGATHVEGVTGALTFPGVDEVKDFRALLDDLVAGRVRRTLFALPSGAGWPLPLYELALLTAAELERRGAPGAELAVVTPESNPVGFFGSKASAAVGSLLTSGGIEFIPQTYPVAVEQSGLAVRPGGLLPADRVVVLARMEAPSIAGLPQDANGFIPVDTHGRVVGLDTVYAVGDATSFPVKQGGIASQQADAAAEAIAATAGASVEVRPFRPVLRGLLLTGGVPRYLRSPLAGGYGDSSLVSAEPLWWPPAKIAGRHLAPALAELTDTHLPEPNAEDSAAVPVTVELPADPDPAWVSRSSRLGV